VKLAAYAMAWLRDPWRLVMLAGIAVCLVFVALPLAELMRQSFWGQSSKSWGLENYQTFFSSGYFLRALRNSLWVASGATVLALLLGVPLAYVFQRYRFNGRQSLRVLTLLSMMSPPFIGAYAWILLFGRGGMVTLWGQSLGLAMPTIYGPYGIMLASALGLYPVVFLVVGSALARLDGALEEAAASLGKKPWGVFYSVTLPLLRPALITAGMLVFLGTIADFGLANLLGEGERFPVLATLAYDLYLSEIGSEPGMAATTSMVLVLVALTVVTLGKRASQASRVANDGGKPMAPGLLQSGAAKTIAALGFATVMFANLPLLVVLVSSFLQIKGAVFQPIFTLVNYHNGFNLIGNAIWNSFVFAGCALVLATLAGVLVGYVVTRRQSADSKLLDFLVMIPFVVPGTVLGIGYASVFNGPPLLLTGSAAIMVIVYFVRRLPYVVRSSSSMVHQIDASLEEASSSLGEKPMKGFRRIMVPLMRPGILAGVVIAWLEIFNELSATLVLYTGATRTLPIAAYQQAFGGDFGVAAVYSSLLILITAITLGLALKLGKMDEQNF
jgi:iron(III) transport system permease protein